MGCGSEDWSVNPHHYLAIRFLAQRAATASLFMDRRTQVHRYAAQIIAGTAKVEPLALKLVETLCQFNVFNHPSLPLHAPTWMFDGLGRPAYGWRIMAVASRMHALGKRP